MKITIGYFNKDGEYIGKKYSNPNQISYLLTGQLIKKIAEHEGKSPYKNKDIDRWSNRFCDRKRIILSVTKLFYGRKTKINDSKEDVRIALRNIKSHFNEKKIYYYAKQTGVPKEDIDFNF